jgi:hypothetical protein
MQFGLLMKDTCGFHVYLILFIHGRVPLKCGFPVVYLCMQLSFVAEYTGLLVLNVWVLVILTSTNEQTTNLNNSEDTCALGSGPNSDSILKEVVNLHTN